MEVTEGRVSEPEPRSIETIQFEQQRKNIEKKKKRTTALLTELHEMPKVLIFMPSESRRRKQGG